MKYLYDAEFVATRLPQKYPLLLVDRVLEHKPGDRIICQKNVTQNEEFFVGHFPERKIMPGVLIAEALAQTCALLGILESENAVKDEKDGGKASIIGFLSAVNLKFLKPVVPGDQLILKARFGKAFQGLRAFEVEALVDKEPVCKGAIKTTNRS